MKTAKRGICLILVLICLVAWVPQPSHAACADLPDSLYLTQLVSGTCTLCSSAMMIRACMYLNNNENWGQVTETSLRPTAWYNGAGLRWFFTHRVEGTSVSVSHASVTGISSKNLKALLDKHPEGIVLYCGKQPHAVYLMGYEGDTFYCADTVQGYSGKPIPLAESWLGVKYSSQASILKNVTAYWYVSGYSDANGSSCNCKESYAGVYECTATETDLVIRSGHSTSHEPVGSIPGGATVKVTKASGTGNGDWAHVQYNGITGYASMAYLRKISDSHTYESQVHAPTCEEKGYTEHICQTCGDSYKDSYVDALGHSYTPWEDTASGQQRSCTRCGYTQNRTSENSVFGTVTTDDLRIRTGPGTSYGVNGYVNTGDRVELLELKTGGDMLWGRIENGWISMDYVQMDLTNEDRAMGTVTNVDILNVRQSPSLSADVVDKLSRNSRVEILQIVTADGNKWGRIENGWVSMQYIQLDAVTPEPEPEPESQWGKVVNVDILNVRQTTSTNSAIVRKLHRNDRVEILEIVTVSGTQWGRVEGGWVMMKYIQMDAVTPEPEPESQWGKVVNVDILNVRQTTSTNSTIVRKLKRNDRVEIFEIVTVNGAQWGRIEGGWVMMKYIQLDAVTPEPEPEPEPESQWGKVVNVDILNVRQTTSTNSTIVRKLKRNDGVEIFEIVTVNGTQWGRVEGGWVMMKYIQLDAVTPEPEPEPESQWGKVVNVDILNVRQTTSTNSTIVRKLKRNDRVEILEIVTVNGTQWGRIEGGWVMMKYIQLEGTEQFPKTMTVVNVDILNVRQTASTSAAIVGKLYRNNRVEVLEIVTVNGTKWGRIANGWVMMDYLA